MAFYVLIHKQTEDQQRVVYAFGPDEYAVGQLELAKGSGEVRELQPAPVPQPQHYFIRASVKVRQHWQQGDFPNITCWAS